MKSAGIFFLIAALPAGALAAAVEERIEADLDGKVTVRNMTGYVVITGWDESAVHVTGERSDQAESLAVHRDGDRVLVEVIFPDNWQGDERRGGDTNLLISVPRGAELDVETVSADVSVSRVVGEQRLVSVSGDIENCFGPTSRQFRSGPPSSALTFTEGDSEARVEVSTMTGDIELCR